MTTKSDAAPLSDRLRTAGAGYDEWRAQDPKDGAYCIAFSWPEVSNPERMAREWLADHCRRFPGGLHTDFVVACVRVHTEADKLMQEAADALDLAARAGQEHVAAERMLMDKLDLLRADLERHKAHIRMGNDIITNQCIAMQSALIDQHHKSPEAGMVWIGNTLFGPGLIPDLEEALALSKENPAQAWFDAKTAEHAARREAQAVTAATAAQAPSNAPAEATATKGDAP